MRITEKMVVGMIVLLLSAPAALACDLKTLPFGSSVTTVATQYDLEITGDESARVDADIRASSVCKDLPVTAVLQFTFLKDKLASIAIESKQGSGELLKLVEAQYGIAENRPPKDHPNHNHFHNLWVDGETPVVLYTSTPFVGKDTLKEYLQIASRDHSKALGEIMGKAENAKGVK